MKKEEVPFYSHGETQTRNGQQVVGVARANMNMFMVIFFTAIIRVASLIDYALPLV